MLCVCVCCERKWFASGANYIEWFTIFLPKRLYGYDYVHMMFVCFVCSERAPVNSLRAHSHVWSSTIDFRFLFKCTDIDGHRKQNIHDQLRAKIDGRNDTTTNIEHYSNKTIQLWNNKLNTYFLISIICGKHWNALSYFEQKQKIMNKWKGNRNGNPSRCINRSLFHRLLEQRKTQHCI